MLRQLRFLSRYQFASICEVTPNPSGCPATGVGKDCNAAMAAFLNCALASPQRNKLERRCIGTQAPPIVRAKRAAVVPSGSVPQCTRPLTDGPTWATSAMT